MSSTASRKTSVFPLVVFAGISACAEDAPLTAPRVDARITAAPSPQARLQTLDDKFVELAQQVPGFGGLAFDDAGNVQVYLTDLAMAEVARPVISAFMHGRSKDSDAAAQGTPPLRFVEGRFDFPQLKAWKDQLRAVVFRDQSVTFLDADEYRNRITVGVVAAGDEARVRDLIAPLGLPEGAVGFEVRGHPQIAATLRNAYSPRIGGLGIGFRQPLPANGQPQDCTHGPRISWYPNGASITNAHCTGGLPQGVRHEQHTHRAGWTVHRDGDQGRAALPGLVRVSGRSLVP